MRPDDRARLRRLDGKPLMFSGAEDLRKTMDRIDRRETEHRMRPFPPPPRIPGWRVIDLVLAAVCLGVFGRLGWLAAEWVFVG